MKPERDAKGHFISKKKKEEPKVEEKTEVEDNHKPFQKRMKMVDTIFKLREKGKSESEIAMYMLIAESWVKEVIAKGYEQTETELKAQYHIVDIPKPIISTSEESKIPKAKKEKKEKAKKVIQTTPKRKRTHIEDWKKAVLEILTSENREMKAKEIFVPLNEKMGTKQGTAYNDTLRVLQSEGKIKFNEESKLYNIVK